MPKVSVIIPIYGVEKYIERCARSLFEQTLDDIEYIFVNDCTKDKSLHILHDVIKHYSNRRDQIKIICHEENKGLSHARETGVKFATGDFIAHCDSDDWVENNMYERLYNFAIENNCDLVKSSYYQTNGIQHHPRKVFTKEPLVTKNDAIRWLLSDKSWNSIWNSLAKKELYNKVSFTDDAMFEDYYVIVQLITYSSSIGIIDDPLYYYYNNPNSICNTSTDDDFIRRGQQCYRNAIWIIQFINNNFGTNSFKKEIIILKYVVRRTIIPIMKKKKYYSLWESVFHEISYKPLFCKQIDLKSRLRYLLVQTRMYPLYKCSFL